MLLALQASTSTAFASDYYVVSKQELTSNGGRVSWSPAANNLIAFDRIGSSGFYDVYTMNPDGSNQVCLTCGQAGLPPYNKGNPDWSPSGDYLVIQVQRGDKTYSSDPNSTQNIDARPGLGSNNVIYIMDAAGANYWEVAASESGKGVLHPHFSHDGTKLIWAELLNEDIGTAGEWEIQYASFTPPSTAGGAPTVSLISTLTPGITPAFYETHGFSLDDSTIFFSGTAAGQASDYGTDIYSYNLNTGAFADLTNTPTYWDEHSRPNPVQEKLFFVSSYGTASTPASLELDYWTMNYDGTDKRRVTWFQDPASDMSMNGFVASDNDWNHDGTQEVIYLNDIGSTTTAGSTGPIYLLTLAVSNTTASSGDFVTYPEAPDALATTFGTNLSDGTANASGGLTTTLDSTAVTVTDSAGAARNAQLVYVSPGQVNWVVPSNSAAGPATVTTTVGSAISTDVIDIETVAPAIFTASGSGSGAPAGYVLSTVAGVSTSNNVYNCSGGACSTVPVDVSTGAPYLILYATGVRHHQGSVTAYIGPSLIPGFTQLNVEQTTALAITPSYAGSQSQFTGEDQINIPLPSQLAGSGMMYLQLVIGGIYFSNPVQLQFQ